MLFLLMRHQHNEVKSYLLLLLLFSKDSDDVAGDERRLVVGVDPRPCARFLSR